MNGPAADCKPRIARCWANGTCEATRILGGGGWEVRRRKPKVRPFLGGRRDVTECDLRLDFLRDASSTRRYKHIILVAEVQKYRIWQHGSVPVLGTLEVVVNLQGPGP